MFIQYNNLDISFCMGNIRFRVLNIARERLTRIIPSHSHGENSYEIHYNASGRGQLLAEGRIHPLHANSLYLVGPHVSHTQIPDYRDPQTDYCIYMQLSPMEKAEKSKDSLSSIFEKTTFWIGENNQGGLQHLFETLFDELAKKRPGYTVWVETLLQQLITLMIRNYTLPSLPDEHFKSATPDKAQAFIIEEAFLYEYPVLTLDSLASRLGLSIRQTQRLMHELYGKTFQEKRNEARMSAASTLLIHTRRTIASISEELGYASPEHFAYAFKKHHNCSASEYRQRFPSHISGIHEPVLDPPEGLNSAKVPRKHPRD